MQDAEILALYFARDEEALERTQKEYGAYCQRIAENILHDPLDAQECVNDTWLRAWNTIPPNRPTHLRLFLAKITRNLAFDRFKVMTAEKRGGGETALILEELAECVAADGNAEEAFFGKELESAINRFVRNLPEREGNLFIRRYFFAENLSQLALRYGLSANHAAVLLSRTRKKLKQFLQKEGYIL